MAISYIDFVGVSDHATNHSANLTVPGGATFALIGITAWASGGIDVSTITLDGQTANLVAASTYSGSEERCWLYEVSGFDTGSVNYTCNFSVLPLDGARHMFMFFDGVDTGDPIHDSDIQHTTGNNQTLTTNSMDSSANDYVGIVAAGDNSRGSCTMNGAYGQTQVDSGSYTSSDYGAAYKAGSGSTDTATCILSTGAMVACTLNPEGGAAAASIVPMAFRHYQNLRVAA